MQTIVMEELNSSLKAFRHDFSAMSTFQQDFRKLQIRVIQVEKFGCVIRSKNKKLEAALMAEKMKRKQDNEKMKVKFDELEKKIATIEANEMILITMLTEKWDFNAELGNDEPSSAVMKGSEPVQHALYSANCTTGMDTFMGHPTSTTNLVTSPEKTLPILDALEAPTSTLNEDPENSIEGISETVSAIEENKPPQNATAKPLYGKDPLDPEGLTCLCGIKRPTKKGLNEHIKHHKNKGKFKCDWCERAYPRLNELHKHQKKIHPDKPVDYAFKVGCRECLRRFQTRGDHKKHLKNCKSLNK